MKFESFTRREANGNITVETFLADYTNAICRRRRRQRVRRQRVRRGGGG